MFTASLKRTLVLLLALLFGIAIVVLSIVPLNRIALGTRPRYAASASLVHHVAVVHAAVHILIFAAAACVAWFAADFAAKGRTGKVLAVMMTLVLGCTTEYLQHAVYRNPLELNDVFTNVFSSAVAFCALALIAKYRERHQKPNDLD